MGRAQATLTDSGVDLRSSQSRTLGGVVDRFRPFMTGCGPLLCCKRRCAACSSESDRSGSPIVWFWTVPGAIRQIRTCAGVTYFGIVTSGHVSLGLVPATHRSRWCNPTKREGRAAMQAQQTRSAVRTGRRLHRACKCVSHSAGSVPTDTRGPTLAAWATLLRRQSRPSHKK